MTTSLSKILLAFYGDDFTGSTDALEMICRAGAKAMLFIDVPGEDELARYPELDAFGVAGLTRSLPSSAMEPVLLAAFERMKQTGATHIHYKVCSTFDSSPELGSIGKAIDCGAEVFRNAFIPVIGGMPAFGRFCVFGNLFAKMGIGSEGKIYRLDRHPSMSNHPSTPMHESDLRIHLGKQTTKAIGLLDVTVLKKDTSEWKANEEVILLDTMNDDHLQKIGEWLIEKAAAGVPQFLVGSSAVEKALGAAWGLKGTLNPVSEWPAAGKAEPLLVVSGSCSPVTRAQVDYAKAHGFTEVALSRNIPGGSDGDHFPLAPIADEVIAALKENKSVIVHTQQLEGIAATESAKLLGEALGLIVKKVCSEVKIKRLVIAGGDTSSYVARAMEIEAVEMIAPLLPGAPLCRAFSRNKNIDGLEVNFKGGQVGGEDYFDIMREGKVPDRIEN